MVDLVDLVETCKSFIFGIVWPRFSRDSLRHLSILEHSNRFRWVLFRSTSPIPVWDSWRSLPDVWDSLEDSENWWNRFVVGEFLWCNESIFVTATPSTRQLCRRFFQDSCPVYLIIRCRLLMNRFNYFEIRFNVAFNPSLVGEIRVDQCEARTRCDACPMKWPIQIRPDSHSHYS